MARHVRHALIDLPKGATINGYRVDRYLGHGWEGTAYLASELLTGVPRVLKLYRVRTIEQVGRLGHVARAFEQMGVTGAVARYHHMGEFRPCARRHYVYLVFDYIEGQSLVHLLRRRRAWSKERASATAMALWTHIAAVHRLGWAVGDFENGNNILLVGQTVPVFCDIEAGWPARPNTNYGRDALFLADVVRLLARRARCDALDRLAARLMALRRRKVRRNTLSTELKRAKLDLQNG